MPDETTFHDLIRRVRKGDEAAAAELVRRYEPAIRRAARVHLIDPRLRRLIDSADISQSVFASFFVRAALGQYDLEKPEQLLGLLVTMSRKKLADHARKQRAARRDYRRARPGTLETERLLAADPDPGQQVATGELIREFHNRLSDEERQLADLRVGGRSWDQIGAERGESPEALRKRLSRAVGRITRELGLDEFDDE
jgi:RNA polymerase sigma-70 factor (ECF subfamily)